MTALILYLLATAVLGVLYCFQGRRYFYPLLMVSVFFSSINSMVSYFGANPLSIIGGVLLGLLLAILARVFYKVALFLMGASAGLVVGFLVSALFFGLLGPVSGILIVGFAILFGILAIKWSDTFITLSTALTGSSMLISVATFLLKDGKHAAFFVSPDGFFATIGGLTDYFNGALLTQHPVLISFGTFVLFLVGWFYQRRHRY